MPRYSHQWAEVLDWVQVEKYLLKAAKVRDGEMLQCIIALAWIFGKRINEILQLKREDIVVNAEYMTVAFRVGKKRVKRGPVVQTWPKKINLAHPAMRYVLPWITKFSSGHIFPSRGKPRLIRRKWDNEKRCCTHYYTYRKPGGYLGHTRATDLLKAVDPNLFWHLFRHSLATQMGKKYKDPFLLKAFFDWEKIDQAAAYVHPDEEYINSVSKRTDF